MNVQTTLDQTIGGIVEYRLSQLLQAQKEFQEAIASNLADGIAKARIDLNKALGEVEKLRDILQHPEHILGSPLTKHGEIAEQIEVHITNARQIVCGNSPTGEIDSNIIPRTGPVDYNINGFNIQSKFCNSAQKSFAAVKEHLTTYPDFLDNSGVYRIPKEQYEELVKILHDEPVEGLRGATQFAIKKDILQFEQQTGRSFEDIVEPSISKYPEVQIGKAGETINNHETEIKATSDDRINNAKTEAKKEQQQAEHISDPSWSEAAKTAVIGAAIGGTIQGGLVIYQKLKSGKKINDLTTQDWKEIGISFGKGSLKGGGTGISIYGLTRVANCPAPLASAIVTSIFSVSSIFVEYKKGRISQSEFIESSYASCYETAICCIGAALGSLVIPPPIGTVVGTLVAQGALKVVEHICDEDGIIQRMEEEYINIKQQLDTKIQEYLKPFFDFFNKFDNLVELLSDTNSNIQLSSSIELCRLEGLPECEIIKTEEELDIYMS